MEVICWSLTWSVLCIKIGLSCTMYPSSWLIFLRIIQTKSQFCSTISNIICKNNTVIESKHEIYVTYCKFQRSCQKWKYNTFILFDSLNSSRHKKSLLWDITWSDFSFVGCNRKTLKLHYQTIQYLLPVEQLRSIFSVVIAI